MTRRAVRRLVFGAALAAAVATSGCATSRTTGPPPPAPTVVETSPASPSPPPAATEPDGSAAGRVAPAPEAQTVAAGFAAAWARPDRAAEDWLAGVSVWCSPAYTDAQRFVDPARVPARAVTGPPVAVASTATQVVWTVPTDGGPITVTTTQLAGRWQVTLAMPGTVTR